MPQPCNCSPQQLFAGQTPGTKQRVTSRLLSHQPRPSQLQLGPARPQSAVKHTFNHSFTCSATLWGRFQACRNSSCCSYSSARLQQSDCVFAGRPFSAAALHHRLSVQHHFKHRRREQQASQAASSNGSGPPRHSKKQNGAKVPRRRNFASGLLGIDFWSPLKSGLR